MNRRAHGDQHPPFCLNVVERRVIRSLPYPWRVIVRIAGEGRWRLADEVAKKLMDDDLRMMRAVDAEHEVEYRYLLLALCRYIRQRGQRLPAGAQPADITVPSPEMTLAETSELLSERPGL
ncbi:MAG: hypothetical protein QOH00_2331 [Gaiellales bacterium]|nr:hypothetical protein [Gaiellales bacterium]